jgi:hypothetical protein
MEFLNFCKVFFEEWESLYSGNCPTNPHLVFPAPFLEHYSPKSPSAGSAQPGALHFLTAE